MSDAVIRSFFRFDAGKTVNSVIPEGSTVLTQEMLVTAMQKAHERYEQERLAALERYDKFWALVPEEHKGNSEIIAMAHIVGEGIVLHPREAKMLRVRYEEIVGE